MDSELVPSILTSEAPLDHKPKLATPYTLQEPCQRNTSPRKQLQQQSTKWSHWRARSSRSCRELPPLRTFQVKHHGIVDPTGPDFPHNLLHLKLFQLSYQPQPYAHICHRLDLLYINSVSIIPEQSIPRITPIRSIAPSPQYFYYQHWRNPTSTSFQALFVNSGISWRQHKTSARQTVFTECRCKTILIMPKFSWHFWLESLASLKLGWWPFLLRFQFHFRWNSQKPTGLRTAGSNWALCHWLSTTASSSS